ncbi:MAG: homoserine O-acetyltransferase MetX [Candidatus Hydrogenedentales bacterium]|jgi:homoserine O-acetyltransferase
MADEGSVGIVTPQQFRFAEPPGQLELDCGRKLGPITLAYETYGTLNADRSNAVLILHALTGDAHAAGFHADTDPKPGWWDHMIGPGKGFDTDKYFVICSNCLGGCRGTTGPYSINPENGKPYGLTFPMVTIGDMVRAQRQLIGHLGIERLLSVAGGSMGGMQVLEWLTRYPELVRSGICIASGPHNGAQAIAFDAVGRHAVQADPAFKDGNYYGEDGPVQGLSIARMLGHITYLSDEAMRAKFGRTLRGKSKYSYDFGSEFSVETYLDYQGEKFVNRFDANSYLYFTKACDYFDLIAAHGSLDEAFARVQSRVMVLSFTSDWLYPPYQSREMVDSLMRNRKEVTYCNIHSDYGHDAFLLEVDAMRDLIAGFLEHSLEAEQKAAETTPQPRVSSNSTAPAPLSHCSIYDSPRVDYDLIVDLVDAGSRVLDIGCGDGELLHRLVHFKQVDGLGLEVAESNVVRCVNSGIPVVQADIDKGLSALPDASYDYVILSMTLQVIKKPELAIREMLRVGKKCIISFPNFGFWKVRALLAFRGKAPVTRSLPYSWHSTPNRNVLSVKDFRQFCEQQQVRIEREIPLSSTGSGFMVRRWPNLFAEEAVYVVTASN